jgi:uncharacterized protein
MTWGLSKSMREMRPWGIEPDWLAPAKTITDPIHGDIHLNRLEMVLVDSPPMQRLRRVRQLGTTHLVYPGASHSRFSHSLGAVKTAQMLLDRVVDQRNATRPVDDVFREWEHAGQLESRVAEATVLARLGALLHDVTHVSFGHSIEDDLGILQSHDENESRFEGLWSQFHPDARMRITEQLKSLLKSIVLSVWQKKHPEASLVRLAPQYAFVADIVGNTICADLLDYLSRDHLHVGLPAAFGERYLSEFFVTPNSGPYATRMVIRIDRHGRTRNDIVSELFKCLRYRYELSERVLFHHAKLAADAMIGRALEAWGEMTVGVELPPLDADRERAIEAEMLKRGDDGLLEHLSQLGSSSEQAKAASELATALLERRLYKRAAVYSDRSGAEKTFEVYSAARARRDAEKDAAQYAGVAPWQVLLWVPDPKMRMKLAGVLVRDGSAISTLREWDKTNGQRGNEIYESHENLWAVSVFVDPKVSSAAREVVLCRLQEKMPQVSFSDSNGRRVGSVAALSAGRVADERELPNRKQQQLEETVAGMVAQAKTFELLMQSARVAAEPLSRNDTQRPLATA